MASALQIICDALLRAPYHRQLSLPQLQSQLTAYQLVQLVHRVLNEIDKENPQSMHRIDLKIEGREETVDRFVHALHLFLYPIDDEEALRQRLFDGDRNTLIQILAYLLSKESFLKKRAYLARFLTPVDVPIEFLQDEGIAALVKDLQERQLYFKELHRSVTEQKQIASTADLKRNVQMMEDEKQNLLSKIAKNEKRLEAMPDSGRWMQAARALREATETNEEYTLSIQTLESEEQRLQEALQTTAKTLKEFRIAAGQSPEVLIHQLKEDVNAQRYMVEQKLPELVRDEERKAQEAQWVAQAPLKDVEAKLKLVRAEVKDVQQATETLQQQRTALQRSRADDKLAVLRTQATQVARKKQDLADQLAAMQAQVTKAHEDIERKEARFVTPSGIKILQGEEFKKFVVEVRDRSIVYKRMKTELAEHTKELEIIENTLRILEMKAGLHQPESSEEQVEEMKKMEEENTALKEKLDLRKKELTPTIQQLKELRQKHGQLEGQIEAKRKAYNDLIGDIDGPKMKRIQEAKQLQHEINLDESRSFELDIKSALLEVEMERAAEELRAYTTEASAKSIKSWKELYARKIQESELLTPKLHVEQQELKSSLVARQRQLQLFGDLKKLLELKMAHNATVLKQYLSAKPIDTQNNNDRLVL